MSTEQLQVRQHEHTAMGGPGGDDALGASAGLATVGAGFNWNQLPVAGQTVAEVRQNFAVMMEIDPQSQAVLDHEAIPPGAEGHTRIERGQTLTFVRPSGEKGAA